MGCRDGPDATIKLCARLWHHTPDQSGESREARRYGLFAGQQWDTSKGDGLPGLPDAWVQLKAWTSSLPSRSYLRHACCVFAWFHCQAKASAKGRQSSPSQLNQMRKKKTKTARSPTIILGQTVVACGLCRGCEPVEWTDSQKILEMPNRFLEHNHTGTPTETVPFGTMFNQHLVANR